MLTGSPSLSATMKWIVAGGDLEFSTLKREIEGGELLLSGGLFWASRIPRMAPRTPTAQPGNTQRSDPRTQRRLEVAIGIPAGRRSPPSLWNMAPLSGLN